MQNGQSGARRQHKGGDVLSPQEIRGQLLKRYVRAAAALSELYDDVALGEAVGRNRAAVGNWWRGARPEPEVLFRLAEVTGLSTDELTRFVYSDGPPPSLPEAGSPVATSVQEGLRRDRRRPQPEAPGTPAPSPRPRSRDSGATRA